MALRSTRHVLAPALALAAAAQPSAALAADPCRDITPEHIFLYEDADATLVRPDLTFVQIRRVMAGAAESLIRTYGDRFDFVCVYTDFAPGFRYGGAFHSIVANDITGLGLATYDQRGVLGIDSHRLQSMLMFYDTHLDHNFNHENTFAHEFAHRWMCYLPPLPGARPVQSVTNGGHFSCRLDAQGGAMVADWTGTTRLRNTTSEFNADTGTRYGWLELYLMGLASPAEMDANMSERRYLDDNTDCVNQYTGPVSAWSSADIIAAAGPRAPSVADSPKDFNVGWILIYEPGQPPDPSHVQAIVDLVNQFGVDWSVNTLGRSTVNNQLFDDADCNGVPDPPACPCELTGDSPSAVDVFDLLAYLDEWFGANGSPAPPGSIADFDGSGNVDVFDLLSYLDCWFAAAGGAQCA